MKHFILDLKLHLLGTQPLAAFVSALFFALIGALLFFMYEINSRDVLSTDTPIHTDWLFAWKDNKKRILVSFITIFVAVRFLPEITGTEFSMWGAFLIGLGIDGLSTKLKSLIPGLQTNRDNLMLNTPADAANTKTNADIISSIDSPKVQ